MVDSRTMMIGDKKYDISRRLNDKTRRRFILLLLSIVQV